MKNVVFMPNIDLGNGRAEAYHYSVKSWKSWCSKHNTEFVEWTEPIMDVGANKSGMDGYNQFPIIYQREWVFDILEHNGIDYDQVLIIDADTIVHPDCPNVFEMTDNKFTVVEFDGSWDWVLRSIESYSKYVFGDYMLKEWWKYFDSGFWIVNKSHKSFAKKFVEFYDKNSKLLIEMQDKFLTGTEQTPLNFMLDIENIDVKHLPYEFNMNDMNRKEILSEDLLFTKVGWIYQFNCISNNIDNKLTDYWMKKAYNYFYGEYKE